MVHPEGSLVLKHKLQGDQYVLIDGQLAWERMGLMRLFGTGVVQVSMAGNTAPHLEHSRSFV
jgi:hypothetical protein